ncbi:hypothetical protein ES705_30014 [subsurface metagenome]
MAGKIREYIIEDGTSSVIITEAKLYLSDFCTGQSCALIIGMVINDILIKLASRFVIFPVQLAGDSVSDFWYVVVGGKLRK